MVEIVVVMVVVVAALVGVVWALRKKLSGKGKCCGCSCTSCESTLPGQGDGQSDDRAEG